MPSFEELRVHAVQLVRAGQLVAAGSLLENYLSIHRNHIEGLRLLAVVRHKQGDRHQAFELIRQARSNTQETEIFDPTDIDYINIAEQKIRASRQYQDIEPYKVELDAVGSQGSGHRDADQDQLPIQDNNNSTNTRCDDNYRPTPAAPANDLLPLMPEDTGTLDGSIGPFESSELESDIPEPLEPDFLDLDKLVPTDESAESDEFDGEDILAAICDEDESVDDVEAGSDDFDWESRIDDLDEYEERPHRAELKQVGTEGRLTRRLRARQQAMELAECYAWDVDGIELLTEVFDLHWWSKAKTAIIRELEGGMTQDELACALMVRDVWRCYPEMGAGHGYNSAKPWTAWEHPNLSWPLSLGFVRGMSGWPDRDEIELFLLGQFDRWKSSARLVGRFGSFHFYLRSVFGLEDHTMDCLAGWDFDYFPVDGINEHEEALEASMMNRFVEGRTFPMFLVE